MFVLSIIGVLIGIVLVYMFIIVINKYTEEKYNYEFFNVINFGFIGSGYVLIYFGQQWYLRAVEKNQDLLNGQLLMAFGVMFIIGAFYWNVKKTSLFFGLGLTAVQCAIYLPLAVVSALAIVIAIAYAYETKPVYNINGK